MKHVHCPVNGCDCPYFGNILLENGKLHSGCCLLYPDCNPYEECDDFASMWDKEDDFVDNEEEE